MLHSMESLQSTTLAFKIDIDDCWDGAFRILSSIPSTIQSLVLHLGGTVEETGWDESRRKLRYPPLQMAERAMIKALPVAASRWEELGGALERFKKLKTLRILHRFVDETPIEYRRVKILSFPKFTCELIRSNLLEFIGNSKLLFC
ncbi:hypothetical protein C8Q75DRAFT_539997 [Abortiporus biennis]|nr:hypothetical protein C8Q75DRAFT_539997 [Abortiporus biennis]